MKNISSIKKILLVVFVLMANTAFASYDAVQLFGISSQPFSGNLSDITPCYLDIVQTRPQLLNEKINQQITSKAQFNEKQFIDQYRSDFEVISHSYLCQFKAKQIGISELPAIVFDGHYVIYGINNVDEARQVYKLYQRSNHD